MDDDAWLRYLPCMVTLADRFTLAVAANDTADQTTSGIDAETKQLD